MSALNGESLPAGLDDGGKSGFASSTHKSILGAGARAVVATGTAAAAAAAAAAAPSASASTATAAAEASNTFAPATANALQLAEEYVKLLDAVGTPNYETIQNLFAGYGCPPASTIPAIQVSFELFEAVQNRFAATKQVLERTKTDLLSRNQQYTMVHQDLHRLQEEYEVLRKRNAEAEERNTELHQQRAKLEVSVEQLRREVGQGRTALDALRNKLARREEELKMSQSRVAENLVALSQKDAVVNTLRRELMKKGSVPYGAGRGVDVVNERKGGGEGGEDEDGETAATAAPVAQDAYTADMLENIAADVEDRAQQARMKLNLADLETRLSRLQEEKDSVLTQHTQYRQHVQLSLQSYEAAAMLREDAMGQHVCLRTPYFGGEQQAIYEKVVNLQTGEKLPTRDNADGDNNNVTNKNSTDASNPEPTAVLPSFTALTFEVRGTLERLSKVHIDDSSHLSSDLTLCVEAQRLALQTSADLVGFLSTMEEEVLHRRLTLPEVREEWKKARVPDFVHAVANALRESVSELGKGLVGLLERENTFVAEIEAAKALQQRASPAPSKTAVAAEAIASSAGMNESVNAKQKQKKGARGGVENVDVGVMARPRGSGRDIGVQVSLASINGADVNADAARVTATTSLLPVSSEAAAGPPWITADDDDAKKSQPIPSISGAPATVSKGEAGVVAVGPSTPLRPPNRERQTPPKKTQERSAGVFTAESKTTDEHIPEGRSNSMSGQQLAPTTSTHVAITALLPRVDQPTASTPSAAEHIADASANTKPNRLSDAPIVLSGVCPHCSHEVTLTNDPSAPPLPQDVYTTLTDGTSRKGANGVSGDYEEVSKANVAATSQASGGANTVDTPSLQISLFGSHCASAASQRSAVTLPAVYYTPADESETGGAPCRSPVSSKRAANTLSALSGCGSVRSPTIAHNDEEVVDSAHQIGASISPVTQPGDNPGSNNGRPEAEKAAAELLEYQQRLETAERTLATVQSVNEELRAQLAAALAAAEQNSRTATAKLYAEETMLKESHEDEDAQLHSPESTISRQNKAHGADKAQQQKLLVVPIDSVSTGTTSNTPKASEEGQSPSSPLPASSQAHGRQVGNAATTAVPTPMHELGNGASLQNINTKSNPEHQAAGKERQDITGSGRTPSTDDGGALLGIFGQAVGSSSSHHGGTLAQGESHSPPRKDPQSTETHTNSSSGTKGRYMPIPPELSRPWSANTPSPVNGGEAVTSEQYMQRNDNENKTFVASLPQQSNLPGIQIHGQQCSGQSVAETRPTSRHFSNDDEDREGGAAKDTASSSAPTSGRTFRPAPQEGVVEHGQVPTNSKFAFKPPTVGYLGSAIQHNTNNSSGHGPSPSFNHELVITGSRSQPTPTTRWSAADRSSASPSQLLHRGVMNVSTNSSNASVTTTVTNKTSTSTNSKWATSLKSAKRTGGHSTTTVGLGKEKTGFTRTNLNYQTSLTPLPPPSVINSASPRLPPVKASPLSPPARADVTSSTELPPVASAFPSPAPQQLALPAINAGDTHPVNKVSSNDSTGSHPSIASPTNATSSQQAKGTAILAVSMSDRHGHQGGPPLEAKSKNVVDAQSSTPFTSKSRDDGSNVYTKNDTSKAAKALTATPPDPAQKQEILHALLDPVPEQLLTEVEPVKLSPRQEMQLIYQVLRLRSSVLYRGHRSGNNARGSVGNTAFRLWQQQQQQAAHRAVPTLGVSGTGLTASSTAAAEAVITRLVNGKGNNLMALKGGATFVSVPGGCVPRPLIVRRVRRQHRIGSRRTTTTLITAIMHLAQGSLSLTGAAGNADALAGAEWGLHATRTHPTNSSNDNDNRHEDKLAEPPRATMYRFYLTTPAEEPRKWSTGRRVYHAVGGRPRFISRSWQKQRRYERARSSPSSPLAIRGLHVPTSTKSTALPAAPAAARSYPPFTSEQFARLPVNTKPYPPFLFSPLPIPSKVGNNRNKDEVTNFSRDNATPLLPMASQMHIYQRTPPRHPRRAVLLLRAKRDPTRQAVKRKVYTVAADAAPPALPSYHKM